MKHLSIVLSILAAAVTAGAAEYTLTVADGPTVAFKDALAAQHPGVTLQAEDTIVKMGPGYLIDNDGDAALTAYKAPLKIDIREGAFSEAITRKGCTYTVAKGASVVIGVAFNDLSASDAPVTFNLAGAGTATYPGAIHYKGGGGAGNQYVTYNLTDDAVICLAKAGVANFSSEQASASAAYNTFVMNKHKLTFTSSVDGAVLRIRFVANFVDPGPVVLDNVGLTRTYPTYDYGVRAYASLEKQTARAPIKLPLLKLVNGAVLNLAGSGMADYIDLIDAENGTVIGKPAGATDTPAASFTIGRLTGSPTIAADSAVTVTHYIAKVTDLGAGNKLSAAKTLTIGDVAVDDLLALESGTAFTVAESDVAVAGACASAWSPWSAVEKTETSVSLTRLTTRTDSPDDYLVLSIPSGTQATFQQATAGYTAEELEAKEGFPILVIGGGIFMPNANLTYDNRWGEIRVAEGVFNTVSWKDFPIRDGLCHIIVEDGAQVRIGTSLGNLLKPSYGNCRTIIEAAGDGGDGTGAVLFGMASSTDAQDVKYILNGDAVFGFNAAGMNVFSNNEQGEGGARSSDRNRFEMNGHKLTFKKVLADGDATTCYVRFRYATTFVDPGEIVFDGIGFTKLGSDDAPVHVYAADGETAATLPKVSFVNGARFNPADTRFTGVTAHMAFAPGTTIGQIGTSDTAQNIAIASKVTGTPSIYNAILTLNDYVVQADDLLAGRCLTSARNLIIKNISVDDRSKLAFETPYTVVTLGEEGVFTSDPGNKEAWLTDVVRTDDGKALVLTRHNRGDEDQYFLVNVPDDKDAYRWSDVLARLTPEELARAEGRVFVKTGKGTLYPYGDAEGVLAQVTGLRIAEGVYRAYKKGDLKRTPPAEEGADAILSITVDSGASVLLSTLGSLSSDTEKLHVTAGGAGTAEKCGAVHFVEVSGGSAQNVVFTLTGDTVFTFKAEDGVKKIYNFSNLEASRQNQQTQNRFECNGHRLTFRSAAEGAVPTENIVRFRYSSTFVDPTTVVIDGMGLTTTAAYGSFYVVDGEGANMMLPVMKFVNASRLNIQNGKITNHIKAFDFEFGTSIGKVGDDAAGNGTLAEVIGCPMISDEQKVTIRDLFAARKSDVSLFVTLNSALALTFADGCRAQMLFGPGESFSESDMGDIVAQCPAETMAGLPKGLGCRVLKTSDGEFDYLRIAAPRPTVMLIR